MPTDAHPDSPDRRRLSHLADEIERRADADLRRLQGLQDLAHEGDQEAVVALRAELVLLRRAAEATGELLRRHRNS